ncbi:unnamed protein product [Symbiodinium sp. CCMP2456]|nr:unnamed protein product [Symbiodinium sp. CCMP2456]
MSAEEKDGDSSVSPTDLMRDVIQKGREEIEKHGEVVREAIQKGREEIEKHGEEVLQRAVDTIVESDANEQPLKGLFIPAPAYPKVAITRERFLTIGLPRLVFMGVTTGLILLGVVLTLSYLQMFTALCIALPPTLYSGFRLYKQRRSGTLVPQDAHFDWKDSCAEFFDVNTDGGMKRRREAAEAVIKSVDAQAATNFNEYVKDVNAIAIYGCGILAATHVGSLQALERHGMDTRNLKALAGVSAGSVVAAMLAVNCKPREIFEVIEGMEFHQLAYPELGSLSRILGNLVQGLLRATIGNHAAEVVECLVADATGPGFNSGLRLEEMIGKELQKKCGDKDITLAGVKQRFGKRLIILACELDSGHERRFTPESDPDLPVRVAVRMSMGVPGLMEPFRYKGHVYCDGGMCNDFPVDALPEDSKRMGLMVRPVDWIRHHVPGLSSIIPDERLEKYEKVMAHLKMKSQESPTLFSVKTVLDLALTSVNIMMDANLVLQIEAATAKKGFRQSSGISGLAPEILTLCGGRYDPFDFNLTKEQHRELYLAGQLSTHLHASVVDGSSQVLNDEGKLKTMLYMLHMDYPKPK